MKKIFVILMVAFIAVASIFADPTVTGSDASNGTARLVVTAHIEEQFPTFALKGKTNIAASVDAVVADNDYDPEVLAAITDDSTLTNSTGATTVAFSIIQTNKAATTAHYQFGVTITDLVLVETADGLISRSVADALSAATVNEKFVVTSGYATPAITAVGTGNTTYTASGDGTAALTLIYKGVPVHGETTPVEVATFGGSWNNNEDAKAGDYKAQVTLTVTAV